MTLRPAIPPAQPPLPRLARFVVTSVVAALPTCMTTAFMSCALFTDTTAEGLLQDAPYDAGLESARREDGHARDVSGDDRAVTRETTPDAPMDHGQAEGGSRDGGKDAGSAPSFCSTVIVPAGSFGVCEDFDEDPDATAFGPIVTTPGEATFVVESAVSQSPPNAALLTTTPLDGGSTLSCLQKALPPSSDYTFQFDIKIGKIDEVIDTSASLIFTIGFGSGTPSSQLALEVVPAADGAVAAIQLNETVPSGVTTGHPQVPVSLPGWSRIVVELTSVGGPLRDSYSVNGSVIETNETLQTTFSTAGEPMVQIGLPYEAGRGVRSVYVDNVFILAR